MNRLAIKGAGAKIVQFQLRFASETERPGEEGPFSGEDSRASSKVGAFLLSVPCVPSQRAVFWFPVS